MTNNSGDMTNKISDERLRELVEKCNSSDWQAPKERCSYGLYINELEQMATELLSARETIRRLMENSKALAKSLESEYYDCDNEPCVLAYHRELLTELDGNGFEPTESHGK